MAGVMIRSETVNDFHAVASIHALAFAKDHGVAEVSLVDALRHRKAYRSDLSLVAVHEGTIIGHVLFNPLDVRVGGQPLNAVLLSPIGVHPDHQKSGIGKQLIEEGHRRATELGYQFSMLLGHPSYYPKFGYVTNMFGTCCVQIAVSDIPGVDISVEERRVEQSDLGELRAMWELWFADVDLAIVPGDSVVDWMAHGTRVKASVVTIDERVAGYVRYVPDQPDRIISFLARDGFAVTALLNLLANQARACGCTHLYLPVHPRAAATQSMLKVPHHPIVKTWEAGMVKVLNPDNPFIARYCTEVRDGQREPGNVVWPVEFDLV